MRLAVSGQGHPPWLVHGLVDTLALEPGRLPNLEGILKLFDPSACILPSLKGFSLFSAPSLPPLVL